MQRFWVLGAPSLCALMACALISCGDDDAAPPMDGGPIFPPASMAQLIAFEGHRTLVNEIALGDGNTLEGATVTAEPGPLSVVASRCTAERCGVVIAVADETPNRGVSVPSPIDAINHFLQVATSDGQVYRGLLSVQPLDALSNAGAMATVGQDVVLASALNVETGSEFLAGTPGPVRWVIFGDATFGTSSFDVSPSEEGPRAGGFAGGPPGAAGEGAGGAAGGGGGAGRAANGEDGDGALGGIAMPDGGACLSDFSRDDCGGGGGGGATGTGGDGAGGLLLAALGAFTGDLSIFANGGAGEGGAGGGGGGDVLLAGTDVMLAGTDVAGGAGEGLGGAGGAGAVRIDAPGDSSGVSVRVPSELIVASSTFMLTGSAPDGATVEARREGVAVGSFASTGEWSGSVELVAGLNRLQIVAIVGGVERRSWSGNGIEIARVGARALPLGATLDVVYLP